MYIAPIGNPSLLDSNTAKGSILQRVRKQLGMYQEVCVGWGVGGACQWFAVTMLTSFIPSSCALKWELDLAGSRKVGWWGGENCSCVNIA